MTDINTMSKKMFMLQHLIWGAVMMLIIYRLSATNTSASAETSAYFIFFLPLLYCVCGMIMTIDDRRNCLSLFVNIAMPFEFYIISEYGMHRLALTLAGCAVALVACIAYSVLILKQKIKIPRMRRLIVKKRINKSLHGSRTIATCCLFAVALSLMLGSVSGDAIINDDFTGQPLENYESWTVENNKDTLSYLKEDVWVSLSAKKKLSVLQTVVNIESSYFGIQHKINVALRELEIDTAACYSDKAQTVYFNSTRFESYSAKSAVEYACHEVYHAYQHRLCDVYDRAGEQLQGLDIFNSARVYKEEFADYVSGNIDFETYQAQLCEVNARRYAQSAVYAYLCVDTGSGT